MATVQEFDFSVDLMRALIWQYNDAERLQQLVQQEQDWYTENQKNFWINWQRDVFDLRTANDFGLSVWSIILGVPLVVEVAPSAPTKVPFGYGVYNRNYNRGNYSRAFAGAQSLTTEQARIVLLLRAFQITTNGAVPQINRFLAYLFRDEGSVYVIDPLDMGENIYVFTFVPSARLRFVLKNYDLLPRPAGTGSSTLVQTATAWGFDEFHENFDNGNFAQE